MGKWDEYKEKPVDNKVSKWAKYKETPETSSQEGRLDQANMGNNFLDALEGAGIGAAQGLSDIGANISQFPGDIYHAITGKPGYQSPRPDFRESIPKSSYGQTGGIIGEFAAPFASPGLAAETMLGRGAPLLNRILLGMTSGAAQSENRKLGAALGSLFPALGSLIRTPKTLDSATRRLNQSRTMGNEAAPLNFNPSNELLSDIEHQFNDRTLAPSRRHIENSLMNLLSGEHAPYFILQSDLSNISRELLQPQPSGLKGLFMPNQSSAIERLTGREVNDLRQRLMREMSSHLHETGRGNIANTEALGRRDFADYQRFKQLRNKAMYGLAAGTIVGTPAYHFLKPLL